MSYKFLQSVSLGLCCVLLCLPSLHANSIDDAREQKRADFCGQSKFVFGHDKDGQRRWGLKNEYGKLILAPEYLALVCNNKGEIWVPSESGKVWCNIAGKINISSCKNLLGFGIGQFSDQFEREVAWQRAHLDYVFGKGEKPPYLNLSSLGCWGRFTAIVPSLNFEDWPISKAKK